jgi:hypothetical protein
MDLEGVLKLKFNDNLNVKNTKTDLLEALGLELEVI